ncbi:sensor histidine kinase [Parabacteroides sp. PF5-9]|uniref:sensor histidine kinase n=1 Tax=Parabacteroides sp. PF5-9 TaxID=1742404 RepID=UPI002474B80D|nr:sensor histidine kinase [Parabacteroides sp. PF5-9]MDH6356568.1 two-component sensor histidine kinase [Parabacteroides sp. PF5-9]
MPFIVVFLNDSPLEEALELFKYIWLLPSVLVIVYYVNYFIFIDRMLFRKQHIFFLLANLLLLTGVQMLVGLYYRSLGVSSLVLERGTRFSAFLGFYFVVFLVIGIAVALKMTARWYRADAERLELVQQNTESELKWLKSQLNPHFLFNTLNNIYSQVSIDAEQAKESIQQLSEMLRYMLYESSEKFVPLENELEFIRNYIELMRIRVSKRTTLEIDLPEAAPNTTIIPLLFISLVENAFKHGISASKPSYIQIAFRQTPDEISFCTVNSYFPKNEMDKGGSGIGLVNVRKRLELSYPGMYSFESGLIDEQYRSLLTIKTS